MEGTIRDNKTFINQQKKTIDNFTTVIQSIKHFEKEPNPPGTWNEPTIQLYKTVIDNPNNTGNPTPYPNTTNFQENLGPGVKTFNVDVKINPSNQKKK